MVYLYLIGIPQDDKIRIVYFIKGIYEINCEDNSITKFWFRVFCFGFSSLIKFMFYFADIIAKSENVYVLCCQNFPVYIYNDHMINLTPSVPRALHKGQRTFYFWGVKSMLCCEYTAECMHPGGVVFIVALSISTRILPGLHLLNCAMSCI